MKLNTLYKRAVNGKINEWTIEIDGHCFRTISGYTDGQKTTTEWTCCEGKNVGKVNETTAEEQAMKEAKAEWTKRTERGYFENIKNIDKGTIFKPMLANKWEDRKDKVTYPLYSQPKLDGIRCIVKSDGMWTRTGKKIVSAPHIFQALKPYFEKNPDLIFDGELYADKYANDFNAIVSLVKKTKPTTQDLKDSAKVIEYHIYDLPSHDDTFLERHFELCKMELYTRTLCCLAVETRTVNDEIGVQSYYEEYIQRGYEGQMLRVPDSLYEGKRSKSLIKHKEFEDDEFQIVSIEEGKGNWTGAAKRIEIRLKDGTTQFSGVRGSFDMLKDLLYNANDYIGTDVTVRYQNKTEDNKLRFPVVVAFWKGKRDL